jgi:hypothetical protein
LWKKLDRDQQSRSDLGGFLKTSLRPRRHRHGRRSELPGPASLLARPTSTSRRASRSASVAERREASTRRGERQAQSAACAEAPALER